jgi:hypothetical protein
MPQLRWRSTPVAPDEVVSHTRTSTRFLTYVQWLTAHDAAFAAFRTYYASLGVDVDLVLPRNVSGIGCPRVLGTFKMNQGVAVGFDHVGPSSGTGSAKTWAATRELSTAELNNGNIRVKFGWTGREWIPIQLFGVPNTEPLDWRVIDPPGEAI